MMILGMCALAINVAGVAAAGQAQSNPPVPRPFPTVGQGSTRPAAQAAPDPSLGLPVYPAAHFLETFDAGKGQQYHLYGTDAPFADIVNYYKSSLKNGGRVIFQGPLMHQFDLGRFQEQTMAYPPSVVVKDYTWNGSEGYLHVSGTLSTRYKTIIQIVPATPGR